MASLSFLSRATSNGSGSRRACKPAQGLVEFLVAFHQAEQTVRHGYAPYRTGWYDRTHRAKGRIGLGGGRTRTLASVYPMRSDITQR